MVVPGIIGLGVTGGWIGSRSLVGLHRRVFRRAWSMSLWGWYGAWGIGVLALELEPRFGAWLPRRSLNIAGPMPPEIVWAGVWSLVALAAWRFAWRRTSRIAGVPESARRGVCVRVSGRIAFGPVIVVLLLVGASGAILWALDRFFPMWDRSAWVR